MTPTIRYETRRFCRCTKTTLRVAALESRERQFFSRRAKWRQRSACVRFNNRPGCNDGRDAVHPEVVGRSAGFSLIQYPTVERLQQVEARGTRQREAA